MKPSSKRPRVSLNLSNWEIYSLLSTNSKLDSNYYCVLFHLHIISNHSHPHHCWLVSLASVALVHWVASIARSAFHQYYWLVSRFPNSIVIWVRGSLVICKPGGLRLSVVGMRLPHIIAHVIWPWTDWLVRPRLPCSIIWRIVIPIAWRLSNPKSSRTSLLISYWLIHIIGFCPRGSSQPISWLSPIPFLNTFKMIWMTFVLVLLLTLPNIAICDVLRSFSVCRRHSQSSRIPWLSISRSPGHRSGFPNCISWPWPWLPDTIHCLPVCA